ncbi:hypothetical protein TrRE_jg6706 [Triparma retinervis]|uniref:Uncharacterized protein n=1 Tax=Triparma retinervis TaxID=2557542 RepID=A0A9W7A8M5_9STRA|nr:hypothetical protein TrRE_jg6706 [Triparma retinervis]
MLWSFFAEEFSKTATKIKREVALPILPTAVPPTDMTPEQVKELQMSLQQQQQQMTMMQQQLAAQQQQLMAAQPQQVTM